MLVFAAIAPHPPLLIPSVGKNNLEKLKQTAEAMKALEQEMYIARPDTLVIVSPHGNVLPDAFTINLAAQYTISLKEFGDHQTTASFRSDFMLIDKIQRAMRRDTSLSLSSEEVLDYGVSVPLLLLSAHLPTISLVPMAPAGLDYKAHYEFGDKLKEEIMNSNKRIAFIASADLSHTLTNNAPGGFSKKGAALDAKVVELIKTKDTDGLLALDIEMGQASKECGLRPISILLGLLARMAYEPKIHSYEGPFGVGHLVANMVLP